MFLKPITVAQCNVKSYLLLWIPLCVSRFYDAVFSHGQNVQNTKKFTKKHNFLLHFIVT
jgi:hypothetical protein